MKSCMSFRTWCCGSVLLICLASVGGCTQEPPPPDKMKLEQEMKQLNEHRQKEWNNQ